MEKGFKVLKDRKLTKTLIFLKCRKNFAHKEFLNIFYKSISLWRIIMNITLIFVQKRIFQGTLANCSRNYSRNNSSNSKSPYKIVQARIKSKFLN